MDPVLCREVVEGEPADVSSLSVSLGARTWLLSVWLGDQSCAPTTKTPLAGDISPMTAYALPSS
jgi:hypothetical protein